MFLCPQLTKLQRKENFDTNLDPDSRMAFDMLYL